MSNLLNHIAIEIAEAPKNGIHRRTANETISGNRIKKIKGESSFQTKGEIFISSADIYDGLSAPAIKLIIRIQRELILNNAFWHCARGNGSLNSGLAQLKKRRIIIPLGDDMYWVNIYMIRKGRPLAILGAMYEYVKKKSANNPKWQPAKEDVKRLKAPESTDIPDADLMIVEEDPAPYGLLDVTS